MRVRITQHLTGSIDGIQLGHFRVGEVYDMGPSLANYLMAIGYALPVLDERPALVTPLADLEMPRAQTTVDEPMLFIDPPKIKH
jgi:hypothetical protein